MSRQFWTEQLAWAVADGAAVTNTVTETIIFPDIVIPANYMNDGRTLLLRAFGKLSTTGTPTIIFGIRWGGVAGVLLAVTEAIANGSGVTNVNWAIEAVIQPRVNGSSGSLIVMGYADLHTAATTIAGNVFGVSGFDAPAAVTADLSIEKNLSVTATWSAAAAGNTPTGLISGLTSMN